MDKPKVDNKKRLKEINTYLAKMPSLSTTVTKVLAVCNSPTSSANDLNRVVSLDPVLTGNVLKLINSAYYSLRDKVTSLTKAIIMLGLNTIKNLALNTAILGNLSSGKGSSKALTMDAFWAHSICTGVAAKQIASVVGVSVSDGEEYFVAGLLHDLGKIPLINCFPDDYDKVVEISKQKKIPLRRSEKIIFGINHCEIGKLIADKWKLTGATYDAICHHHDPENSEEETRKVTRIVALANIYAQTFQERSEEEGFVEEVQVPQDPLFKNLVNNLDIKWYSLMDIRENIYDEIEKAKIFLQITQKG